MEIATTYVLLEDGQEICYTDAGLPADFSRNFTGPERGAFKAAALSASASTMFVINGAGEMYTRLADFDTTGCAPMFFKYTYIPYKSGLPGTNYLSNLTEWGLPAEDRKLQIDCTLYANMKTRSGREQEILRECLGPIFMGTEQGVPVRISFDGQVFEIREHPARHTNVVIFRGEI
jgi:hypothetical protein